MSVAIIQTIVGDVSPHAAQMEVDVAKHVALRSVWWTRESNLGDVDLKDAVSRPARKF